MNAATPASLLELIRKTKLKTGAASRAVKLTTGKTTIRILQKTPGAKFWAELGVHWVKDDKGKIVAVTGCHEHVKGENCDVCGAVEKAAAACMDDDTLKMVKEWKVKKSYVVEGLIRSGAQKSDAPQIIELTASAFNGVLSIFENYSDEGMNMLDPGASGVDLVVERTGSGPQDTKYTVTQAVKSAPVPASALENLKDLDAWVEKEFFARGDDPKALRAISGMMGFPAPAGAITGPANRGLLTSSAVSDADLEAIEEVVAEAPTVAAPKVVAPSIAPAAPVAAPVVAAKPKTKAELLREQLAAAEAAEAAEAEANAALAEPAPVVAAAKPADTFGAAMPESEVDALLAELG
jgi:hypothetical protein